jgi:hypothetical protein
MGRKYTEGLILFIANTEAVCDKMVKGVFRPDVERVKGN